MRFNTLITKENIGIDQVDMLTNLIDELVNHKELGHFFNSKGIQYNERTLLSPEGDNVASRLFCCASQQAGGHLRLQNRKGQTRTQKSAQ
ncbi:MAG: hypothetical protein CM15mP83_2190 [Flavobacteriaceae bacterium]|nr:MAG: hypothetical protein CM15mP83_2190 [Flavobacteriaceae bacterium]